LAVAVTLALLAPSVAHACPNCVGGNDRLQSVMRLVGLFMLVPFAVVYFIIRAIRRAQKQIAENAPDARPPTALD
jgi:hypothetical protein